MTMDPLQIVQS